MRSTVPNAERSCGMDGAKILTAHTIGIPNGTMMMKMTPNNDVTK